MEEITPLRASGPDSSPPLREPEKNPKSILSVLAAIGVIALKFLAKLKFLLPFLLKTGGSMLLMIGVYWSLWGWQWAVGFVVLLLVHECGHLVAAKWFGLNVGAPVFIPFMGAFIALKEAPRNAWMEACVGIGGPLLGTAGAICCHLAGIGMDWPLLIGLAWTGYWLNLFNMIPLGQLDGGRIVSAVSRWFWVPGVALMGYLVWQHPNFLLILILVTAIPRLFSLFRKRTEEEKRYYTVTPRQRVEMTLGYFGLIAALVWAMHTAETELDRRHVRPGRPTAVE